MVITRNWLKMQSIDIVPNLLGDHNYNAGILFSNDQKAMQSKQKLV
jgi:hypothetical protein